MGRGLTRSVVWGGMSGAGIGNALYVWGGFVGLWCMPFANVMDWRDRGDWGWGSLG